MPKTEDIIKEKIPAAISRMISQAQVFGESEMVISNHIRLCSYLVNSTEPIPEEHGRLLCLPFTDGQYSVQILYLQHDPADAMAATITVIHFHPDFFAQWPESLLQEQQAFRFDTSAEQQFVLCLQSRLLLGNLLSSGAAPGFIRSLQQTETALHLLRRATDSLNVPFTTCPVPACRFLAYESEREKIFKARAILEAQYDQPMTIKELSRKVAMNECYLKKGFKALVGKTIHEFQQEQRIVHARQMLQQEGKSVTEVAAILGYSSISHFSTAFKKATGTKPCELLQ